jgi:putative ABC transport system permease protein
MAAVSFERTIASAKRTMVLSEIARLAVDSFLASKVRFVLTALGMVIGSASLILVVTIGLTGKAYVLSLLESIGTNEVIVDYLGGNNVSLGKNEQDFLTIEDVAAVRQQVPGVLAASPLLQLHDTVSIGDGSVRDTLILGVDPEYKVVRNLKVTAGRFFDQEDNFTHAKLAVVTPILAKILYGSPDQAVGQHISIGGIPFSIIGVFKESVDTFGQTEIADQTILIPYPVARYFTGTDSVKEIYFSTTSSRNVESTAQEILRVIQTRHRATSVYTVQTLTAVLTVAAQITNALTIVLLLISSVTLIVSGVGIMNIMLANVRARIREIGIRKAVGATYREIRMQFLIEAVFISLSGGFVGTLLGLGVPIAIRLVTGFAIPVSLWSAVIALATATLIGVIFGTLPATRAAQMDPVESLKYE